MIIRRLLSILCIAIAAISSTVALSLAGGDSGRVTAAAPRLSSVAPAVSCDFTVLNFNLVGTGSIGASHPISITTGDTFEQFIATPITATADSLAYAIVNNNFSGGVSGGVVGTFTLADLNGLLITSPEGSLTTPRGFELNDIVIHGATGTITAAMAINIAALSSSPPYFPRAFNGYLHSISTSGSYASYKYNGAVAGTITSTGGVLTITAAVIGRLYANGGSMSEFVAAARTLPLNRTTAFDPSDMIAQFHLPDFTVGTAAPGHVTPRNNLIGTTIGTINGGFVMDHEALVVDGGTSTGKGWFAGEFTFSDTGGNLLTGPWLADLSNNAMVGYVWQVVGTGIYTDSLLFGTINGSFLPGGANFTGTMAGVYCEGSQIPTPTATIVSPTATETGAPVSTNTSTPTSLPTTTSTNTPVPNTATPTTTNTAIPPTLTVTNTNTAIPATATPINTNTPTNTPTSTPTNTDTAVPLTDTPTNTSTDTPTHTPTNTPTDTQTLTFTPTHTSTSTDTATSTSTPTFTNTPTNTPEPCSITFMDVPTTAYFYGAVLHLYCRGVISGYSDNTFHPYDNTTRAQLCKIIVLAEGWPTDTSGGPHFNDVSPNDALYGYMETAFNRGVINGYNDGTFRPNNDITRAQLCKIIVLAQQWAIDATGGPHFSDVSPDNSFYSVVETAYNKGVVSGYNDGTFRPNNSATRGQICKIVYQTISAP